MSHEVAFKSEREAMNYAIKYNRIACKKILKALKAKTIATEFAARIVFSFAGIQGCPVTCFVKRYKLN
jgi:hypothetical protein